MTAVAAMAAPGQARGYVPRPARVLAVEDESRVEKRFELALESGDSLDHSPGQFVQVSLLGVGESPISISSSPTRPGSFELCIRRVGEVTERLHRLRVGDVVGIRGPLGHGFDVEPMVGKDVIIVSGGLGLAPARSLIHYILDRRDRFAAFHLLYGAREPGEMLFRGELSRWKSDPNVNLLVTVDRPDEGWRGRTGVVTTLFRDLPRLDPQRTTAVIIGPPIMFKFVVLEFLSRRIPERSIFCSLERRMKCGVGKCGHCQASGMYVCLDGPVFSYAQLKAMREALE